ncbi:RagB/SusD family nutrient uptake outer membrane protein [Dyadobacter sp. CY323]|uniref:RagB/SusD family nutrient uptake outer membrane protein n=1 Tax=Dyadobacter sp. CY323 TaxID=2907302 RepID=UPI001F321A22|nr:RagB/SusD family nutrient uptake outer membrane protein [Dyadobacter sp. CY323]MCE6991095.1 RagB/SusD family nutrient uptake outer membrane protein [Dyadobacter sp. CY323]
MKIHKLVLAASLFVASSCGKDFVDLNPQDVIPVGGFYKTESDIKSALTGTYGYLRGIYNGYWQFFELPSDNTQTFTESESGSGGLDKLTYQPVTTNVSSGWNSMYHAIADCNAILDRIGPVTMAEANRSRYIAEAKFIRALMYFNLVRMYGGVPLILKQIETEAEAYTYIRSTEAEVYAQIEKDLAGAETVLPLRYGTADVGRATAGAAKALLGKVYLQQKKWVPAESKLAEVIALDVYKILPTVNAVFGVGNDNNAEIIFSIQYLGGGFGEGNSFAHAFAPQTSGSSIVSVVASSTNIGTQDLYDSFAAGDLRRDAFLGVFQNGKNPNIYYWAKKFVYNINQQNEGSNDWPVIRYADVLLMYAEALNNNNKTTEALTQVNVIRKRAGLPVLAGLSKEATQLAIEAERRAELCFEGHRWPDLIRWGKEVSTMQAFKAKYTAIDPLLANMNVTADKKLLPIPLREINLNPKLTQNPGYN